MTEQAPQPAERLSSSVFALSIGIALIFLYLRTFLLPATPFVGHDDQMLFFVRAARILHGQVPYRDFFELVTPGIDLLYAASFRIFGIHAWVIQAWSIALGLALSCVITYIAGKLLRGRIVLLPALLFLVFDFDSALDPTHHWYSTLFALVAISFLIGGASLPRIFAAGALCGVATLFTQTAGALTFAALVIYLVWLPRSKAGNPSLPARLAALVFPFLLTLSCALGYYIHKAGLHTMLFDTVLFPLKFLYGGEVNSPQTYLHQLPPLHTPSDIVRLIPFVFIYALVPYIYLFGLVQLHRKRDVISVSLRQGLVLLHLVGLALFLSIASGPRFHRLCTVAPPAILVCVWLLNQQGQARRLIRNLALAVAIAFFFIQPIHRQLQWHAWLNLPIGRTAFLEPAEFHQFQWLARQTHPSEPFFNQPILGLYLSLDNPAASEFVNDDDFTRPEQVAAVLQSLRQRPPHFIILYPGSANSTDPHNHSAPFRQYVRENYRLTQVFSFGQGSRREEVWESKP